MDSLLTIKIFPNARKTQILGYQNGILRLSIKEPAENQKANQALIRFLSELLHLPQNQISILSGKTSRHKVLKLSLSFEVIQEKISNYL